MFMTAFGIESDGIMTEFVRAKIKENSSVQDVIYEGRGRASNSRKLDLKTIEHILSFNAQVSHYQLEHAPNRRYLDHFLTARDMWKDYKAKYESTVINISYERVFNSMYIGFWQALSG